MFDRISARRPRWFGIIDLTQGFHQIALSPDSCKLTAFITHGGLYEYTRIPFGPKNAPSYFQQHVARIVLKDLLYQICELYIDDIIVYGDSDDEFLRNVRTILNRFKDYGVVVKPTKCQLGIDTVEYVGRVLTYDGTTMRDETTLKVLNFPVPEYIKKLRSFLGLVNYFRDHIYGNLSEMLAPLQRMITTHTCEKTRLK